MAKKSNSDKSMPAKTVAMLDPKTVDKGSDIMQKLPGVSLASDLTGREARQDMAFNSPTQPAVNAGKSSEISQGR